MPSPADPAAPPVYVPPQVSAQVNAAIDAREAREKQRQEDERFAQDKAKFVETLRGEQAAQKNYGLKASLPYTIDAAGNIFHVEPNGSLRPVSDAELRYPSAQTTAEADRLLAAARAESDSLSRQGK